MEQLKKHLDAKLELYNRKDFIKSDPVQFAHSFTERKDVEVAALLASLIAWGNRTMILRSCSKMLFDIMERKPYDFVMTGKWHELNGDANIHRTFFVRDLKYICNGLQNLYSEVDTLERLFVGCDVWSGFARLRNALAAANEDLFTRHIATPEAEKGRPASACKRLNMMLRWLVRRDGIVDLGMWREIDPASLMIPLDVHVARTARDIGLVTRKQNDRRTVEELTATLSTFCPEDPVKYDFALFGVGVEKDSINIKIE